jgi:malonyl CoA-acyl carrier protein transacylase
LADAKIPDEHGIDVPHEDLRGRFQLNAGAMRIQHASVAIVCPGHGGEHNRMRTLVSERRPDLLALAERLVGCDPFERVQDGTTFVQPAVYCASIAGWEAVEDHVEPIAVAGHSLGELAAAAIAGAISTYDGLRLAVIRGRACQQAADEHPGGMLILKADAARASELAAQYDLEVANQNAPLQTVLAGAERNLDALYRDAPALRVPLRRLRTAVPFHTEAMRSAAETLGEALCSIDVAPPRHPLMCAATARPFVDVRTELASALVRPVRWRATTYALSTLGASRFLEVGPGSVLCRLIRQTLQEGTMATSLDSAPR